MGKHVHPFGIGEGGSPQTDKKLLGGKGAGLATMAALGIPVPPGFTIDTNVCMYFQRHEGRYPDGLEEEVQRAIGALEEAMGRRFGDPSNPLLLSVRSGAAISMPGMMDTILNLGLDDEAVARAEERGEDPRFVRDCYRRLISMYGDVVLGVPHEAFEKALAEARRSQGVENDAELSVASLDRVIADYERLCREHGKPFPTNARDQLWGAIGAVFGSWDNRRARDYRRLHGISDDLGTAVNVQTMVFGNRGEDCATGVAFTRNPATGEPKLYGEYLVNAQGEDVVAGIRTPQPIEGDGENGGLAIRFPEAHRQLQETSERLEHHYREMQDVEFTIEGGKLYMLQCRTGKRTGPAAVRIAVDLVREGLIDERTALQRVEPAQLGQLLAPGFDLDEKRAAIEGGRLLAKGLPAGPGAACGRIALTAERAEEMAKQGAVLLVREETSPEDIVGMHVSAGILTARGGMTSHAAVVARGLGKPCIVGAGALHIDEASGEVRVDGHVYREGDELAIDGTTGEVIAGRLAPHESPVVRALVHGGESGVPEMVDAFQELLGWADEVRRLKVRANADTPEDARVARAFGAEGIGLCRTEHMFFAEERIAWVREMILAGSAAERERALGKLLPEQQGDFEGILAAMEGLPVTIRLLDPPLHEFLPKEERAIGELAGRMGIEPKALKEKVEGLAEVNPMLGHRGCRLGLTAPEIYAMQVEAIVRGAIARRQAGEDVRPEIMLPLVGTEEEIARLRRAAEEVIERVAKEAGVDFDPPIGTMIEVPRACLVADAIARHTDFFSFGTNDLTQMTYGYSRDDVGRFLPQYLEAGIVPADPFETIDQAGVGALVEMAVGKGRDAKPGLKIGICGEHGGEPSSVAFFHRAGLDYVSCSPYRVPIARLAAARAELAGRAEKRAEKRACGLEGLRA